MMDDRKMMVGAKKAPTTYIDMDGVLARFEEEPNALERFPHEKGFFAKLQPTKYVKQLNKINLDNIFILTSSPNAQADRDKVEWIAKHIPELAHKVITVRSGEEKALFAKGNILIDDYTDNLKHWNRKGGIAIKAINAHNGNSGLHTLYAVNEIRVD